MALIFDRGNKVSPVCILRRSIWTKFIQKVKILVTTTNRPARSKWKFVAILLAITVVVSYYSRCAAKWKEPLGLLW